MEILQKQKSVEEYKKKIASPENINIWLYSAE